VDQIRLGYVTRALPRDNRNHLILGTQTVKPRDFAAQMNLSMDNCWGIVTGLLNLCADLLEGDGERAAAPPAPASLFAACFARCLRPSSWGWQAAAGGGACGAGRWPTDAFSRSRLLPASVEFGGRVVGF
jgi:hypothetical protein